MCQGNPAFDLHLCETNGFISVEFDGCNNAMLPSHDKHGDPHVEYPLDRGSFDSVPLEEIRKALIERKMHDCKAVAGVSEIK